LPQDNVSIDGEELSFPHVGLRGGAPLPASLIGLVSDRRINTGQVFDPTLPLDRAADGDRALDERRAVKTRLRPDQDDYASSLQRKGALHARPDAHCTDLRHADRPPEPDPRTTLRTNR
jgi:hypothetical protein